MATTMKKHLRTIIFGFLFFFGFYAVFSDYGDSAEPATKKVRSVVSNQKVHNGDTVYGILSRIGFSNTQRNLALSARILPANFVLAPGDIFQVVRHKPAKRTEVVFFDRFKNTIYSFWKAQDNKAGATVKKAALRKIITRARGTVKGSLVESINHVVKDELLAYRFMDAFLLDYDLKGLQRGAQFALTYEKLYSGPTYIRGGEILHAELEINGKMRVREYHATKHGGIFVAPKDHHANRPLYAPVDYIRISSLFQPHRYHPIKKTRRAHLGVDFELPEGENVYAAQDGRILRMGKNRAAGNYVVIRHKNGLESYYNHMIRLYPKLRPGMSVHAGDVVGYVGSTGYSTKPHLHFAVKRNGKYVNPINLIRGYTYAQRSLKFISASAN